MREELQKLLLDGRIKVSIKKANGLTVWLRQPNTEELLESIEGMKENPTAGSVRAFVKYAEDEDGTPAFEPEDYDVLRKRLSIPAELEVIKAIGLLIADVNREVYRQELN